MSGGSETASSREYDSNGSGASSRRKAAPKDEGSKGGWFPIGYKEGFNQWWASMSPQDAEHKVLSYIPYLSQAAPSQHQTGMLAPGETEQNTSAADDLTRSTSQSAETPASTDPYGPRRWYSSLVKLSGKQRALNEFSIERVGEDVDNNLVMVHGYGAGLGFFYKNFEGLSRQSNWKLYALDLLGMGRSSRPSFKVYAKDRQGKIDEAEAWFVDSLEEWRKQRGIDRFTLLGHSLGGYMAVAYALKYPGHLNKLILASPVGVPEDPYAVNADMPEPGDSTVQAEVTQDAAETTSPTTKPAAKQPRQRPYSKWFTYLWDANVSPFSLIRMSGPLGPRLVSGWTSRRFSHLPSDEAQALHDYAYSLFRQRGSGEYALAYVLAPGAFARSPLIRRIAQVGRQEYIPTINSSDPAAASAKVKENGLPVVFFYGDHDWMDKQSGREAAAKLNEQRRIATQDQNEEARQQDQGSGSVHVVRNAGHHVYLDGWEEFNKLMVEEMKDTARSEEKRRRREVAANPEGEAHSSVLMPGIAKGRANERSEGSKGFALGSQTGLDGAIMAGQPDVSAA
ncbi:MAG: hypothetical protein Q9162_007890 [Coniocarpon cinnabarinum]